MKTGNRFIDLTGRRYGRFTVIKISSIGCGPTKWHCRCDCGNERIVDGCRLKNGTSRSCGCLRSELQKINTTTHGKSKSPDMIESGYKCYGSMKERCLNKNHVAYPQYGGRGISICSRWLGRNGFSNFIQDMGPRPSIKHSIDRIDVNGCYEPSNCRWSDKSQQSCNRRNNVKIEYMGKSKTVLEWSRELGIIASGIYKRIKRGLTGASALGIKP